MKASDRQVGGSHYRTKSGGVGHWDYCIETNVPYLEGCASKYLTRWRDKNGLQDLEKACHYIERRLEAFHSFKGVLRGANKNKPLFEKFILDNGIPNEEAEIVNCIMHWKRPDQLIAALSAIQMIIRKETQDEEDQFQLEIAWSKSQEGC